MSIVYNQLNVVMSAMCIIMCVILFTQQMIQKEHRKKNKWFILLIVFNTLMLMGDFTQWYFGGRPGKAIHIILDIFTVYIYYFAGGAMMYSAFRWALSLIKGEVKIDKKWFLAGNTLLLLNTIVVATMSLHKGAFITNDNYYSRNDNFLIFLISLLFGNLLTLLTVAVLIRFRKNIVRGNRLTMYVFLSTPAVAMIFQISFPNWCIQNVIISFVLIFAFSFSQAQREIEHQKEIRNATQKENVKLIQLQRYQKSFSDQLINVLTGAIEAKDKYTQGHSGRVARYSREIVRRWGGDEKLQEEIYFIGILHDIGKISIPDEVINKRGKLTDEEYAQIKLHTTAGYQILRLADVIPDLATGARWHHERFDGKGYPNGLKGEEIPLIARIISVADAYDAMTSSRSYRDVLDQKFVRNEIEKGMGTQFDPEFAQIMLDMIDEDVYYEMRQRVESSVRKILVIDKDAENCKLVKEVCNELNHEVVITDNEKDGVAVLNDSEYDICLIDMDTVNNDKITFLKWVRLNAQKTKVITMTADLTLKNIKSAENFGVVDCVSKPINRWVLKRCIIGYLRD
ncbi:MAG: HD domain-containing protein [Lachnospiraceae bacterium]|nr:HD domain-containing protein [Lachnospiraceae bacterium]